MHTRRYAQADHGDGSPQAPLTVYTMRERQTCRTTQSRVSTKFTRWQGGDGDRAARSQTSRAEQAPGPVSRVITDMRGRGERRASAVRRTGEAHLVLLAQLPTRLSAEFVVGRVAGHRQARLDQARRLPDGCR